MSNPYNRIVLPNPWCPNSGINNFHQNSNLPTVSCQNLNDKREIKSGMMSISGWSHPLPNNMQQYDYQTVNMIPTEMRYVNESYVAAVSSFSDNMPSNQKWTHSPMHNMHHHVHPNAALHNLDHGNISTFNNYPSSYPTNLLPLIAQANLIDTNSFVSGLSVNKVNIESKNPIPITASIPDAEIVEEPKINAPTDVIEQYRKEKKNVHDNASKYFQQMLTDISSNESNASGEIDERVDSPEIIFLYETPPKENDNVESKKKICRKRRNSNNLIDSISKPKHDEPIVKEFMEKVVEEDKIDGVIGENEIEEDEIQNVIDQGTFDPNNFLNAIELRAAKVLVELSELRNPENYGPTSKYIVIQIEKKPEHSDLNDSVLPPKTDITFQELQQFNFEETKNWVKSILKNDDWEKCMEENIDGQVLSVMTYEILNSLKLTVGSKVKILTAINKIRSYNTQFNFIPAL